MVGRQKRLHEAYEYLRRFFGIHTQTDFAEVLKYSRVYISAALNGNEKNLTDKLFTNICEEFPGVFNLDYLLTGKGDLLAVEEDAKTEDITEPAGNNSSPTNNSDTAIIMSKTFEMMLKPIMEAHDKLVATLEKQIADKDAQIKRQADIIANLQNIISELRTLPAVTNIEEVLNRYPYPVGVAETKESTRAQI